MLLTLISPALYLQPAQIIAEQSEVLTLDHASPGYFVRLRTPEGGMMGINYATNDSVIEFHTGAQVSIYGYGVGTNERPSFMRQSEIYNGMVRHLGLER